MTNIYNTLELTKDNHLQYWFNNDKNQHWRRHPFESSHMSFGYNELRISNRSFMQCITDTALEFGYKHLNEDFHIFLSGGLDSEVAVRAFVQAKVNFRPIILKFINDFNKEDVYNAKKLCNELDLNPIVADIDPIRFFESGEWLNIGKKYQAYTFYQQLLLQAAESLAQPMITIDEIEISRANRGHWIFVKNEDQDGCWHRFIEKTGIPAYNNFYTYDPDTAIAFIESPTIKKLINNEIPGKLGWSSSKNEVYDELTSWNMNRRPKRHGMERLMNIWTYVENHTDSEIWDSHRIFRHSVIRLQQELLAGRSSICNII